MIEVKSGHSGQAALDSQSFQTIARLAYEESGLTLVEEKRSMICSRLRHRLRALNLSSFADYSRLLVSGEGARERRHLISALTTNVSHFFREPHHFEDLETLFRSRLADLRAGDEMRLWSAGCSNGQEALSAAMTLLEAVPDAAELNLRILATDIDAAVVAFAREGIYPERLLTGVSPTLLEKYFHPLPGGEAEPAYAVSPALRRLIKFNELNLLRGWPMRRQFDAIFCRNVVIYFDVATQEQLWPRFRDCLKPHGRLYLGHSERIVDPPSYGMEIAGPTSYRVRTT